MERAGEQPVRSINDRSQMGVAPQGLELTRDYRALTGGREAARRARGPEAPNYGAAILFLLPAAILLIVFLLYPSLYTVLLSFNRGRNGAFEQWVGFDNYVRLFGDPDFINLSTFPPSGALWNNVLWIVFYTSIVIFLGLMSLPISVLAVTLIVNVIKLFDLIYVMTAGGPGKASRVIAFTMYQQAFQAGQYGYGSAVAVVMLVLLIPIMIYNVRRFRTGAVT